MSPFALIHFANLCAKPRVAPAGVQKASICHITGLDSSGKVMSRLIVLVGDTEPLSLRWMSAPPKILMATCDRNSACLTSPLT